MNQESKDRTILLVDDEEDIRDVLSLSLADIGYTVHTAENGVTALNLFKRFQPLIVMTDIKMPGMDGIELLQRIKRENRDCEVVMITGHGDMDLAIRSLKNEATDFITKPINVDALEIALKRVKEKILMKRQLKEYTESLESLVKEKIELQDHLSSLGLMIGSISHGIKGLLTGLDGGIYLVDSGLAKQSQEQIKDGWETVKQTVERIRKMVLDILYYAKERSLQRDSMDALEFADELADAFRPKIVSHSIEFIIDFDSSAGSMEVDAGYVHSALSNILENAVDACIRDTSKARHQIAFRLRHDPASIFFEVSDNGIGMDREMTEKIFTPFYSSKGRQGTGLGLFISEKIIHQHGGDILVKSKPDQGTVFTIRIPKKWHSSIPQRESTREPIPVV